MHARSRDRTQVALAVVVAAACLGALTSCESGTPTDRGAARSVAPTPTPTGEDILVRTRIAGFTGEVLDGSVLGGAAFCPGGAVRHEHGSPALGFPAVNVLTCPDGVLSIGFGPGPDQMDQLVQTSDWRVVDGSGAFVGATGAGTMRVRFDEGPATTGHETFTGVLVVP